MGQSVNLKCKCGAEVVIEDFPVDEYNISKRDVIELSLYHLLKFCPTCDPNFDGSVLDFELAEE
jgi:hypothetical protein